MIGVLILLLILSGAGSANAESDKALELRGGRIVTQNCSSCHAVGSLGRSRHPEAPAFRELSRRYPIDALAEALAEGLSSGHPDMPEFEFPAQDVAAILAYLKSIQKPNPSPSEGKQ
jgi:mono/diheme cytochrome c family protein